MLQGVAACGARSVGCHLAACGAPRLSAHVGMARRGLRTATVATQAFSDHVAAVEAEADVKVLCEHGSVEKVRYINHWCC